MNRIDMSSLKALSRSWLTQTTNEDAGRRPAGHSDLRRQRATDLPVMAEWIDHPPQAPPVRFLNGEDRARTCGNRLGEHRVRVWHGQDHSNGTATERLRTEVAMLRGLVTQPELRALNIQPRHHRTGGIRHTKHLDRPKGRLVELDRARAVSNRQHGRD